MLSTEQDSHYSHLDTMSTMELLQGMNAEDKSVPVIIEKVLPQIGQAVERITERMRDGGRVFYIGCGTSGRIGIIDASEIPPTYGVRDAFIGIISGGDAAIRTGIEGAEDDVEQAWKDICQFKPTSEDTVIGITASGHAPYVIGALTKAREEGLFTACITCNEGSPVTEVSDVSIVAVTGPEFVTGSTRLKAGTAAKLILNMISTTVMIKLGHVKGCKMVDMELTNKKLVDRGTRMVMEQAGIPDYETARHLLLKYRRVRDAVDAYKGIAPDGSHSSDRQ